MTETIAIALSGGIDSLMTAALLKDQGHKLFGIHFLTGFEKIEGKQPSKQLAADDFQRAESKTRRHLSPMMEQLDIPLHIIDLRNEFKRQVVDYFVGAYRAGKTPNPCQKCNPSIKFGLLYEAAKRHGATRMATGHYARLKPAADGRMRLLRGVDPNKDQSYFLARLRQDQLRRSLFPLGDYTKDQTRQMARNRGFQPAARQESQDICFIKTGTYGAFLKQQTGFIAKPGPIVDLDGNHLGTHNGLYLFTVGQRRGINCPSSEPYYVVRLDVAQNRLVVGRKADLAAQSFTAEGINWIIPKPASPIHIWVRVRYRHQAVPATLTPIGKDGAEVRFDTSQPAVTPGQGAVFYQEDEVLGGGWIQ
ncbi:MAG: tRNA 2-thiouridine(34) synthase MnmA [Desulfobacteraceae bacterium]